MFNQTFRWKLTDAMNTGWLREMDGENTEEDRRLYANPVKSTGQISHHSVKKGS